MATQLDIINRVLRRLREDTVAASTSTDYAGLVSDMVVDAVAAIEEEHAWRSARHTISFDTIADQRSYVLSSTLSNGGDLLDSTVRVCTSRSTVLLSPMNGLPLAFRYEDASDATGEQLMLISETARFHAKEIDSDQSTEKPYYFSLDDGGSNQLILSFVQKPADVRRIKMYMITDRAEFASDGTTDTDTIYIPTDPVFWHAYRHALNERGEELGEPGALAERRYYESLAANIAIDLKHDELTNVYDWYRG